ncbi:hypothetical protein DTO282F9_6888 [Paecilomyces variotii]|nr:hypothetical protein DTO282E5_2226 [Paecilomyces variotii]KAJ9396184.1 hypothetical protein DTO282F9_6888 [Paecilomyces variotii]
MLSLLGLMVHLALLVAIAGALSPTPDSYGSSQSQRLRYANHIFNAIHSSMRQWGSSLNHNGMSFFWATVPEGTELYHGTHQPEPVNGTEWLAFEPEHAMLFAGPRPKGFKPPHFPGQPGDMPMERDPLFSNEQSVLSDSELEERQIEEDGRPPPMDLEQGWLHTYAATKDLRLLYIDGMSAAKSDKGVYDTQDRILLNDTVGGPGFLEYVRAQAICKLAQERWDDRIDGVIRMESGFEIILCNFQRDLEVVRITRAKKYGADRFTPGFGLPHVPEDMFRFYKAIADRYHGIGGHRVRLNYDNFVTAFSYDLDLFRGGELPRLANLSTTSLEPMRKDLVDLVMKHDPTEKSFDWQGVVDMIVQRYSNELKYLVSEDLSTSRLLHRELDRILRGFIDFDYRNTTAEIERCATQFIPKKAPRNTLAGEVVYHVSHKICSTLFYALEEHDRKAAVESINDLVSYLSWTTWKECNCCAPNEVCFIPIWPVGTYEDREHPRCRGEMPPPPREEERYWELPPRPHKRRPHRESSS